MLLSTHAGRAVAPFYGLSVCYPIYPVAPGRLVEEQARNLRVLLSLISIFLAGSYA